MEWSRFTYREVNIKVNSDVLDIVQSRVIEIRDSLGEFIKSCPEFRTSLLPLSALSPRASRPAKLMDEASRTVGTVGPMAAVAGCTAWLAAQKAHDEFPGRQIIVENGGDLYCYLQSPVNIGIYPGDENPLSGKLALSLTPDDSPVAVCSSSGKMGHSLSFGNCDLAMVLAQNGALADAAATAIANLVKKESDLESAAEWGAAIPGIRSVLIFLGDKVSMAGERLNIIRSNDHDLKAKVTRDWNSNFPE